MRAAAEVEVLVLVDTEMVEEVDTAVAVGHVIRREVSLTIDMERKCVAAAESM